MINNVVYSKDLFATVRTTLAKALGFQKLLDGLVEAGTIQDADWVEEDTLATQGKCFALISPDVRIECSMVRQWGRRPNPSRDTVSISFNTAKYPGHITQFLADTGIKLEEWGFVR